LKFFLDHDVPAEVARVLRQEEHEVTELLQEATENSWCWTPKGLISCRK
jgi:hypothetical protein